MLPPMSEVKRIAARKHFPAHTGNRAAKKIRELNPAGLISVERIVFPSPSDAGFVGENDSVSLPHGETIHENSVWEFSRNNAENKKCSVCLARWPAANFGAGTGSLSDSKTTRPPGKMPGCAFSALVGSGLGSR
jgi:hypothetical protein